MLVHLSVHNYAIVEHLDLELATGMSVITGETGAGKSIMLDALGLTLGDRADSGAVRPGADKADILASFDVSAIAEARDWLAERDLEQDGPCILRRVITAEGRSRAYINGTPCPLGDLKSLGELLIDIHSQHEHQSLLKSETHRRLLDEYAGCQELARQVQLAAQRWKQTSQELERLSRSGDEQRARHQLLSYQLEELENLSLGENELESLEQEQKTLSNAESLLAACRQVVEMCSESDAGNVLSALNASLNRLTSFSGQPAALGEAVNLLSSAQIQVEEAIGELNRFVDHFDADPNRQQQVEERLDVIYSLARKHRVQPAELADLQQRLFDELEALERRRRSSRTPGRRAGRLRPALPGKSRRTEPPAPGRGRTSCRQRGAGNAAPGHARGASPSSCIPATAPSRRPTDWKAWSSWSAPTPGSRWKGLAKVASGGELSRISLAIQVITAQTSRIPTLVFDEVDVGIGGPTAEVVGQLLRRLGERGQVLTVTHLPQVAAQGHQHLFVHKERGSSETRTAVATLNKAQRIEEIARMLGGVDLTKESLAHAKKLVNLAAQN